MNGFTEQLNPGNSRRRKGLRILAAASVSLTAACGAAATPQSSHSTGPVNIGVVAGFTGGYVSFSDDLLDGVKVAGTLIDQAGGIFGQKINVIPVNDALDPTDTLPAVQKMLATDNISLCACFAALDYEAGLPVVNNAKMVSVSYIGPDYGNEVMPYHWNMNPADDQEGLALAYYAKEKGYKRIALLFDTSVGAQSFVPSIRGAAAKLGLDVVANVTIPENVASYQTGISQLLSAHPQAVLSQVEPAQAGAFFQQWASAGATSIPMIATDQSEDQEWLKAAGSAELPYLTTIAGVQRTSSPFYSEFVKTWSQVVSQPFSYVGGFMYDGTIMAALAMVAAHSTDPTVYNKYITAITQPGPGKTTVYSFADGVKLLKEGKQIKYSGITGPLIFNQYHRPTGDYGAFTDTIGGNPTQIATISANSLVGL
jgi:ABC-type branched-subunit amino acid transport system substrate-binding protein